MVVWIIGLAVAVLVVHIADLDPFTLAGVLLPIAVGCVLVALIVGALLRRRGSGTLAGAAAGAYAAWFGLVLAAALHGTPFGYSGMSDDEGRLVAQAMKYMTSWRAVDAFVHNLPTEYPPLYPWAVGHVAAATHRPAWQLMGEAQILVMSGALVLCYLMWRRLIGPWPALLIVVLAPVIPWGQHGGDASKAYEFIIMLTIAPWILATFLRLPRERGGLHWLPAGVFGGLMVLTYSGYLIFALPGLLVMVALVWRSAPSRSSYLLHVVGVVATAFVVASWYVVPYLYTSLTKGSEHVSDFYRAPSVVASPVPLPFLGVNPLGLIDLIGLVGLVWYRRREWWAQPLILLILSAYGYRIFFMFVTAYNDHTGYLEYTDRFSGTLFVAAGSLTLARALPSVARRLTSQLDRWREVAAVIAVAVSVWAGVQTWALFMPHPLAMADVGGSETVSNWAGDAHLASLPGGKFPRYAPPTMTAGLHPFPIRTIQEAVRSTLGPKARPVSLSYTELLFAYSDYYAYLPRTRIAANSLQRWDVRYKSLQALAQTTDPAEFARASQHLQFGRIDLFVLRRARHKWVWPAGEGLVGQQTDQLVLEFDPRAFGSQYFHVTRLSAGVVVAVRRPG